MLESKLTAELEGILLSDLETRRWKQKACAILSTVRGALVAGAGIYYGQGNACNCMCGVAGGETWA